MNRLERLNVFTSWLCWNGESETVHLMGDQLLITSRHS
jgi:hypothetical protein